jgi:sec-independent protein translocase protein TatA
MGGMRVFQKIGFGEIMLILAVVLLIFGPAKLPQLGRSIGESIREFKKGFRVLGEESETTPDMVEKR